MLTIYKNAQFLSLHAKGKWWKVSEVTSLNVYIFVKLD